MLKGSSPKPYFLTFTAQYSAMKIVTYILIAIALGLIGFNIYMIDFSDLTGETSIISFIGIASCICAILVLVIFTLSKSIQDRTQ
jgi:type IV secretory pathway component VirB8